MTHFVRCAAVAVAAAALAGCAGTGGFDSTRADYKSASKLPPLDIPPDLTKPERDERHEIPEINPTGTATFSAYSAERTGAPKAGSTGILPDVDKLKLERSGTERWLVVPEPPEKVWPKVKEFWQEVGFLIKVERPEAGVMETDWLEDRSKIPQDGVRTLIGRFVDGLYSSGQREKFRTRLERGSQPDTTEIYITHRGMVEVYVNQPRDSQTMWQARPSDPGLEAEFLRRMMVRFGMTEARAKGELAAPKKDERAKMVGAQDGLSTIELAEPFDRAWRRVGLVLDRAGFTVEDRNRSSGYYFVRYVGSEADAQKDESFLSKLAFWRSAPDPKAEQYRVFVKDRKDVSEVQVLNKEGNPDPSETARKILSLLQEQLK
jgi:outer membrane protein assembly factor BamC